MSLMFPTPKQRLREEQGRDLLAETRKQPQRADIAKVVALIEAGAAVDAQDDDGNTGLLLAAEKGNAAMAEALLAKGAHINHKNHDVNTALLLAAYYGHESVVKLLIDKGAKLEEYNHGGNSAASWALQQGHEKIAKMIKEAISAEVNARIREVSLKKPATAPEPSPAPTKWPKGFKL